MRSRRAEREKEEEKEEGVMEVRPPSAAESDLGNDSVLLAPLPTPMGPSRGALKK